MLSDKESNPSHPKNILGLVIGFDGARNKSSITSYAHAHEHEIWNSLVSALHRHVPRDYFCPFHQPPTT